MFPRPGKIEVRFGEPLKTQEALAQGHAMGISDDAEAVTAAVRERVMMLSKGR